MDWSDPFSLVAVVSFVTESLLFCVWCAGLGLSLRRWLTAGLSARLAASGFGLHMLALAASFVISRLPESSGWTFYTPYSATEEPDVWEFVGPEAAYAIAEVAASLLILAALWTAWRRFERNAK